MPDNSAQITKAIAEKYTPATHADYDGVYSFQDFEEMFEPDSGIMPYEIENVLREMGWDNENTRAGIDYLVRYVD